MELDSKCFQHFQWSLMMRSTGTIMAFTVVHGFLTNCLKRICTLGINLHVFGLNLKFSFDCGTPSTQFKASTTKWLRQSKYLAGSPTFYPPESYRSAPLKCTRKILNCFWVGFSNLEYTISILNTKTSLQSNYNQIAVYVVLLMPFTWLYFTPKFTVYW